jgi:hypothetical protein
MSFVLMEDLRKPLPKRRFAFVHSIRIFRPLVKAARFAYRGSRFLLRRAIWVIKGAKAKPFPAEIQVVKRQEQ